MKHFVLIWLLLLTAGLWAQSPTENIFRYPLDQKDQKTMDAFKTTCARLAEHRFTRGNFEQEKTISSLNRSLKSSGNFIIASGLGMVWDTVKPFPSTLTLGNDYIIQSRPGKQKTILNAAGNDIFISMSEVISSVFSGNSQGLLDNFEVFFLKAGGSAGGAASNGADSWELGLSPRDAAIGSFAQKIIMEGGTAIRSILIYEQNGDTVLYKLLNHSYPAELNDYEKAFFTYP